MTSLECDVDCVRQIAAGPEIDAVAVLVAANRTVTCTPCPGKQNRAACVLGPGRGTLCRVEGAVRCNEVQERVFWL